MSCCDNFDNILYNFISPVTGRVLADYNYVLVGNRQGIAIPSPILIDIRLDLIALRARYNTLVQGDIVIGQPNDQLPNAQVLSNLDDGFLYTTAGVLSTNTLIPIEALPDLPYQNIWIGDITNRPTAQQRVGLINLPTFLSSNPFNNFGLYNLYTGQFSVTSPTEIGDASITQRIDMSNMPHLSKGKMWLGTINYTPPVITIDNIFPYVHVTGSLNWSRPGIPPSNDDAVPIEVGLNPGEIFIGDSTPGSEGQITTTLLKVVSNLPDLTYRRIWRGDITNRPVEVDDLTLLEGRVTSAETTITSLQFQIGQLEVQIGALQFQIGALDTALGLLTLEVQAIATTVGGLVISVATLGGTVAALGLAVTTLEAQVSQINNRTLNQIPLATGDVNLNNHRIINLANPIDPLDAVNLQTMQAAISTGAITSVTGTANQITANTVGGAVTISLPTSVIVGTSVRAGNMQISGNILQSTNSNGNISITPNGTGNIQCNSSVGINGTPTVDLDVFGTARTTRMKGNGNAPVIGLGLNTVVGTGATASVAGNELGGRITVITGTGISVAGIIARLTFAVPFTNVNYAFIISFGNNEAATSNACMVNSNITFATLRSPSILTNSTTYVWSYVIIES